MSVVEKLIALTRQLYPTGRAFRVAVDSYKLRVHRALAISEDQAYNDALSTLNSALPDNEDFTEEDAAQWEHRLGLITNEAVLLDTRKAAIIRKMNHPGTVPARQHFTYLEGQLQAAGFDVYVHENRFDDGLGGTKYGCLRGAPIGLATTSAAFHLDSATDEIGLLFTCPAEVEVDEIFENIGLLNNTASAEMILYSDPTGTPVARGTVTVTGYEHPAAGTGTP